MPTTLDPPPPTPTPDNNEVLKKFQEYKNEQQKLNTSSGYTYSTNENPAYKGETVPPQVTAREILAQRQQVTSSESRSNVPIQESNSVVIAPVGEQSRQMAFVLTKPTTLEYSKGTKDFNKQQEENLKQLMEAKTEGFTKLEIYDTKGNLIKETNPQDIVRARYDILRASIDTKGPVTVKGEIVKTSPQTTNEVTTSQVEYVRKNDNAIKTAVASIAEPFLYTGLTLESAIATYVFNKNLITKEPGPTTEQDITNFIQKSIGVTPTDQIMKGDLSSNQFTPTEKAVGLVSTGIGLYVLGGGKGSEIKGAVKSGMAILFAQKSASKIASGLQEGSLASKLSKQSDIKGNEIKGTKVYEFQQGTEGKSGISSYQVVKAPEYEIPSPGTPATPATGQTETIKPELPSYLKPTTDITGIGAKGEKTKITKPTEVILNPEAEGQAKKPTSFIGQSTTAVIRSEPQNVLPPQGILVTDITPEYAEHIGLKLVPGMKNTFYGKATRDVIEKISYAIQTERMTTGTDIFYHSSQEFKKNPIIYSAVTDNPELFKSINFGRGGAFEGITRPTVLRTFQGKQPGGYELKTVPETQPDISISKKPSKPLDLSNIPIGKITTGGAGRAASLIKEITQNTNKPNIKTGQEQQKPSEGKIITLEKPSGRQNNFQDIEYGIVVYPPKTSKKDLISLDVTEKTNTKSTLKTDELQRNIEEITTINKQGQNPRTLQTDLTIQVNGKSLDTSTIVRLSQETDLVIGTDQTTKQEQTLKQIIINIPGIPEIPPTRQGFIPSIILFNEEPIQEKKVHKGKPKQLFFAWNVNTEIVGGYLPGKELRVGKTTKVFRQKDVAQNKFNRQINRKTPVTRSRTTKQERSEKQTFSKLDKSIYQKPSKEKKIRFS